MRKIIFIIIGLVLVAGFYYLVSKTGSLDKTYRERDQLIVSEYKQLKIDYVQLKINHQQYLEKLKKLSNKEDDLFNEVKLHKFENITEHNYWHRGRLKFPSSIKTELDIITKAEKDSL
jgi:outer membrane protein assembly factor BamA